MQSNILVTGGAGYIGSIASDRLKQLGANVVIIDDLSTGHEWAIPKGCQFFRGNIGNFNLVSRILKEAAIDSIIHFAASTDVFESMKNPLKYFENNLVNSVTLLKAANENNVKHFIFSSTAAVYGNNSKAQVRESDPTEPISPYGQSKLYFESVLNRSFTGTSAILRYFNVAGAKMDLSMGQNLASATHLIQVASEVAKGKRNEITVFGNDFETFDGTGVRDYIHVEDLVNAHIHALQYLKDGGKSDTFNCGYGKGYSVLEIVDAMKKITGREIKKVVGPRRPGDVAAIFADNSKIRSLGWVPQHDDIERICWSAFEWEARRSARGTESENTL